LKEIFNFFTTKEKGLVGFGRFPKILNDHNGELLVSSQVGEGSVLLCAFGGRITNRRVPNLRN
jgi:hypothetical protein